MMSRNLAHRRHLRHLALQRHLSPGAVVRVAGLGTLTVDRPVDPFGFFGAHNLEGQAFEVSLADIASGQTAFENDRLQTGVKGLMS
jgi:hypothetical protein